MILTLVFLSIVITINNASAGLLSDRFVHVTTLNGQFDRQTQPRLYEVYPEDVTLYLHTRDVDNGTAFNMGDFTGDLGATGFDPRLPTFFWSHGWTVNSDAFAEVANKILQEQGIPANIFLVDYRRVAKFFYTYAVSGLPKVGDIVGDGIKMMVERYSMDYSLINIMGHSLGGQLCGFIGASLGGQANQIISLDPAGPLFQNKDPSKRLDPTDARHVQVIHTCGALLAYDGSLGHADYFANSGRMTQPNCGSDLVGLCAHVRAAFYYAESLLTDQFVATQCDNWNDYLAGACDGNEKSSMGMLFSDKQAMGNYYLKTAGEPPFALG